MCEAAEGTPGAVGARSGNPNRARTQNFELVAAVRTTGADGLRSR